jgi:secondary thiamine-phosphate synthase enzyme
MQRIFIGGRALISKVDIKTNTRVEFQDITSRVNDIVRASGVAGGICYIFVPHTTAGVMVNEHADPSVVEDIAAQLDKMVPEHGNYRHLEGNSPAHIKAALIGDSETLFIEGGKLVLGTWQGIFFSEFDGQRNRNILVKIVPDKS